MTEEGEVALLYEENEVCWAKIRGFPWWPAYVNEVHSHKELQKFEYTVIFFGDNTHSRLGPFKLRKFPDNYTSFYIKSKTNRKLKISILKAEERLKQNQQDVEIYEKLRNSIKTKKKTGTRTESRGSSSDKQSQKPPQFRKSKTTQNRGRKRKKQEVEKGYQSEQDDEQQNEQAEEEVLEEESEKQQKRIKLRRDKKKPITKNPTIGKNSTELNESPSKKQLNLRTRRSSNPPVYLASKQEQQIQVNESKSVEKVPQVKKPPPKKKGRPKKISIKQKQPTESQQYESDDEASEKEKSKSTGKRKLLLKPNTKKVQSEVVEPPLSAHQAKNIEKIKKCMNNKAQLIQVLSTLSITPNNVKEILDLGVSNVLLDGQMTKDAYVILQSMKATLLHKYFPDDLKMKKKHERMMKKKKNMVRMKADEAEKSEKNEEEQEEKPDELDNIRKKTVLKIQRILRKSGIDEPAKNLAIKLQGSFQQKSEITGEKYTNIAYNHLRKLKNKVQQKESCERIIDYLNQITESVENSADR